MSISELGISREDLEKRMPQLIEAVAEDMSVRTSARTPLIKEIPALFLKAYDKPVRP